MVLILVFREHEIDLEEETTKALLHTNTYNECSIQHIGFKKEGIHWVHRGAQRDDEDSDVDEALAVVPMGDIQFEELAARAKAKTDPDHPEALDRPSFRLDAGALVMRVSLRIIDEVSTEI